MKYSKRHSRKIKPNKAQRQQLNESFSAMASATDERVRPKSLKPRKAAQAPLPRGPFQDRAGVAHVRESRSLRPDKNGLTIQRRGPRPVDTKRAQRLSKTLNQHAK